MANSSSPSVADRFVALVGVLNRECELLEHLVFKLREAELLADAGEGRFLMYMTDEIDGAASNLGSVEVARAVLVSDLTGALGLDDDASLLELAEHADALTAAPLLAARTKLLELMAEVDAASGTAADVVSGRLDEVALALDRVEGRASGSAAYESWSSASGADVDPARFDQNA